jgi:hypothetical protein
MNKATVHDRKAQARKYRGEAEAAGLLNWLNAKNPSDSRQHAKAKVERVMELLKSLHAMAETTGQRQSAAFSRGQKELNMALFEYEFINRVDYDRRSSGLTWNLSSSADLSRDYVRGEAEAIVQIRDLDKMGVLAQVRQCACGEYFFVRFPNREPEERFHSTECQVKFGESSPARREQKRKKAREYYYLHRNKNVK